MNDKPLSVFDRVITQPYHNNGGAVCGYKVSRSDLEELMHLSQSVTQELEVATNEVEALRDQLAVKQEQLRLIDEQRPFVYRKEVKPGMPEWSDSNEFSDGFGGGLALYANKPIINVWPNVEYANLIKINRSLLEEIERLRYELQAKRPERVLLFASSDLSSLKNSTVEEAESVFANSRFSMTRENNN